MKQKLLAAVAVVALLASALPAVAALDGSLAGFVKDKSGQPLPGVSVTLTGPALQGSRTTVTKNDGSYNLPAVPPGAGYKILFALSGFRNVESSGLSVQVSKETQANAVLELATVSTELVVTGEAPVVDTTQTNTSKNFSSDYLRKVPIGAGGRSYQNVLQQAPGVVGGGNPNVLGGNILENSFLVDGINTTDPVTHTFAFNLNFDAIQEINLQTSGFTAEYGRATGGIVNVVTKSGGNDFSGSADVRYSTNKFSQKGDFFDPDQAESRNSPWGFTLGGPILKDRIWFFGNLQRPDNFVTPFTTNATVLAQNPSSVPRSFKGWNSGLKLSLTATERLNGFLNVTDALATVGGSQNSTLYRPEANSTQRQRSRIYNAKFNGIFSASWLGELQIGRSESLIETGPTLSALETSQWINIGGGNVRYDAYSNYQKSNRNRNLIGLNSTYYLSGVVGNHAIKAGFDADKTEFPSINFTTGTPSDPTFCPAGLVCGATFQFRNFDAAGNRVPTQQTVTERTGLIDRSGRSYAAYLQDQWSPIPQLTLNLGLRWDRNEYINNIGKNVINFDKLQPRLSAAYDILGDGKNVVRANYGTFYVDAALTLARLFDTDVASAISRIYTWNATTQKWVFSRQTGGVLSSEALVDGPLKSTYDEQLNIAFERQLFRGASASVTYIYKKTKDIYEDTCIDQVNCPDFWLSNQPGRDLGITDALTKDYYGYQASFSYNFGRGVVNASYTYSKSRGSIDSSGGQYAGGDFDYYPYNFQNRYGFLGDDARHRVKIFGSYRIPVIETDLGVNYSYRSGLPYDQTQTDPQGFGTVFVEPRGSRRTPNLHVFDLSLEKKIALPFKNLSVSVIGTVLNVLDTEQATTFFSSLDSPATNNTPSAYQRPRNYELGFRIDF